jgi:hypothetical protein
MKNIFRTRTSLIIACVVIGIVIGSVALNGCRTSYGLIEGMETKKKGDTNTMQSTTTTPTASPVPADASKTVDASKPSDKLKPAVVSASAPASATASASASAPASAPASASAPSSTHKDGFEVRQPIGFSSLQTSSSDDWNLSRWVKDAARYAKGMGNENKLDSYQYNSGPSIPLPEGELYFFKDTKFDPSCCPGTYSNSMGCACLSKPQFNYLTNRGGNHTIPNTKTAYYNEF